MKRSFYLVFFIVGTLIFVAGCGNKSDSNASVEGQESNDDLDKSETLVIKDDLGREVILDEKPEDVVVLTPTLTNMFYDVGGKAMARMTIDGDTDLREEAVHIEEDVGHLANINVEKLVSLNPDLVIGQVILHEDLINILEDNGIPVVIFEIRTYDQVIEKARIFSQISAEEEKAEELINELEGRVKKIRSNLPEEPKKVAILFANNNEVTLETSQSTAGNVAELLGIENVVNESDAGSDMLRVPFSMEELVERDPDVLLIVTWEPDIVDTLSQDPAWSTLRAIQEGEVHILPRHLFTSNPGFGLHESIEHMRDVVYPESMNDE